MSNKSFSISLVMLSAALCAVAAIFFRSEPVVAQTNLERLPMTIAGYTATEGSFPDSVYKELNADKHVYRHYRASNGDQVDLYIGYYGTAKGGRTGHNPYACLPGAGAAIVDTGKVYLEQEKTGKAVEVNYILAKQNDTNTVMLHWYQTAGWKVVSTGYKQNVERFVGKILRNRNDGAFVRITAEAPSDHVADAKIRVKNFAVMVLQLLPEYWPEER